MELTTGSASKLVVGDLTGDDRLDLAITLVGGVQVVPAEELEALISP